MQSVSNNEQTRKNLDQMQNPVFFRSQVKNKQ